ncbi:MAG: hypothetical protein OEX81_03975 [Candidatus Pacebacteria bacterium]|nr:hypothetical protein [Candidatus Paceibacterota bacterium]
MKKIISYSLVIFLFLFSFANQTFAQTDYKAVLLLSTQNPQTVAGNLVNYDLILNTLGNDINEIDVQFLIKGPFDRQSMTFNLHPDHRLERLHNSAPLSVVRYQRIFEGDDGIRVQVVLKSSDGKPFNEGSGAIPVYRVNFRTNDTGTIKGYIDSSHSYVKYTDVSKIDYDNYTPESRAKLLTVISNNQVIPTPTPRPVVASPSSTPNPTVSPTSMPESTPLSKYDEEFERVTEEIEELKGQVEEQENRISLLEKIIQSFKNFFGKLFN